MISRNPISFRTSPYMIVKQRMIANIVCFVLILFIQDATLSVFESGTNECVSQIERYDELFHPLEYINTHGAKIQDTFVTGLKLICLSFQIHKHPLRKNARYICDQIITYMLR